MSKDHPLYDAEKSWPQVHKMIRLAKVKTQNIQKNTQAVVKEVDELVQLYKEIFTHIPKTDGTLFGYSPMSAANVLESLMDYIFKLDGKERNFSRRIKSRNLEPHKAMDFANAQDLALGWATKMEKITRVEEIV